METVEIVKKHANDWKFLVLGGLTAEEMRAIRANLPQFARSQLRQVSAPSSSSFYRTHFLQI